jgi:hypothetical protein
MQRKAARPEDLSRFFVRRANAYDVEGLVELYEPDAVLVLSPGRIFVGHERIRRADELLLAAKPTFEPGVQSPAICNGALALTSTSSPGLKEQGVATHVLATNGVWKVARQGSSFAGNVTPPGTPPRFRRCSRPNASPSAPAGSPTAGEARTAARRLPR